MAAPKAKTYLEKLGFFDEELRTPKHDDMFLWLIENYRTVIKHFDPNYNFEKYNEKIVGEYPVKVRDFIVGFLDAQINGYAFEIKTQINSIGELLRQINTYRIHLSYYKFIIISPDDRFEKILQGQGILFYKYPLA